VEASGAARVTRVRKDRGEVVQKSCKRREGAALAFRAALDFV